jgi:hypothetical protein
MKIVECTFKNSTIINFTDRFHTVLNYSKVVYLGNKGRVKEQDDPQLLLKDETSDFYRALAGVFKKDDKLDRYSLELKL